MVLALIALWALDPARPVTEREKIMTDDFAHFDLALELRDAESRKPWPSGLYSKMLVKKDDLRVVLFL